MMPGPFQILLVIILILLLFGASRVPDIAGNLAKGIKSFKKGLADEDKPDTVKIIENQKDKEES